MVETLCCFELGFLLVTHEGMSLWLEEACLVVPQEDTPSFVKRRHCFICRETTSCPASQEHKPSCAQIRDDICCHEKTLLVGQDDMSFCGPRRHVCLSQEDMSSFVTSRHIFLCHRHTFTVVPKQNMAACATRRVFHDF